MRIERNGTEILAGDWPPHPEQTALLEARGALLAWDVLADNAVPSARVYEAQAADWLWEIYGTAAAEILSGATEVTVPVDGDWRVRDASRVLAQLGWVEAWWPASQIAGVPAVDQDLLLAERAVATSEAEHLLDDEDATERALSAAGLVDAFATRLAELAEDYGVVLREVVAPSQVDFALAASGDRPDGVTVLSGRHPVDWGLVPSGVVDAAADAEWVVVRSQGTTYLEVVVPLVTRAQPSLVARFGQVDVQLDQTDGFGRLTGLAPVPSTVLLLPPDQRVLTVYAPDFAQPGQAEGDSSARRAANRNPDGTASGPVTRWKELHNGGAELVQAGDIAGAQSAFEAACVEAGSGEERAATLVDLSAVVDMGGDPFRAADLLTEAIELATPMRGVALATRADIYMRLGQWDEAWQDLDDAHADAEFIPEEFLRAVTAGMHASWAAALVWTGQFGEAAAAAQVALDLAYRDSPQLAPAVHRTLAEIAGSTGDLAGGVEHHSMALELCAALNDGAGAALSTLSLARLAYLSSDNDRAEALYDEAEQLFLAVGEESGRAICAHGRAGGKIGRGQARAALELLDQVVDVLNELPTERVAVYQLQGAALETLGDYAQADERYAAAMTVSEQAGMWHVVIGIAWWRADALVRWASTVSGEQRGELSRRALDLALPAALAAEAVRQRFATRSVFEAIAAVQDVQLAWRSRPRRSNAFVLQRFHHRPRRTSRSAPPTHGRRHRTRTPPRRASALAHPESRCPCRLRKRRRFQVRRTFRLGRRHGPRRRRARRLNPVDLADRRRPGPRFPTWHFSPEPRRCRRRRCAGLGEPHRRLGRMATPSSRSMGADR